MTTTERTLYYAASLTTIVLIGLRLFHLLDPKWGMIGVLLCSILITRVYANYANRLTRRNAELEKQLENSRQR